ncbi:hypothetical protein JR782_004643 [Salmonella enterica subsp. enterica serovar Eastbourne]|nr:hypothetical protein [Salmonella enterica subsp. enterica serovar Eastbourne]EHC5910052.1 hypothetical protein [Salmonella enterica subsp. enterica serovar Eastbourne]
MMVQKIKEILVAAIKDQDQYLDQPIDLSDGDSALLYTDEGPLDSLSLVTILADVEKKLLEIFGKKVQLANERDLSTQDSPFKTFGQMVSFINARLAGAVSI